MQNLAIISDIGIDYKTGKAKITFLFDNKDVLEEAEKLQGNKLIVDIKKWFKKRSKNANAYLWRNSSESIFWKFYIRHKRND